MEGGGDDCGGADVWRVQAERKAKLFPKYRVGLVQTGVRLTVQCKEIAVNDVVNLTFSVVDVPGAGNCLYHAVWQAAKLQGIDKPFGSRGVDHVYALRVKVAECVVSLLKRGQLCGALEDDVAVVGALIAEPDQYVKYSGQVPLMAMSYLLRRSIVTLCADGVMSVTPHNFRELTGTPEVHTPIAIFHCEAGNVCSAVAFEKRNHYAAVVCSAVEQERLREVVEQYRRRGGVGREHVQAVDRRLDGGAEVDVQPVNSQPRGGDKGVQASCEDPVVTQCWDGDDEAVVLKSLSSRAMTLDWLTNRELWVLAKSQNFATCPRLALLYFHSCSNDPRAYVFNDEHLLVDNSRVVERLSEVLDGQVSIDTINSCRRETELRSSSSLDVMACASCCELLRGSQDVFVEKALGELHVGFRVPEGEMMKLAMIPPQVLRDHVQVVEEKGEYFYLNPDLVRDTRRVVLCVACGVDPRKVAFSIASGHDYGRPNGLPGLNDVGLNCIAPVRCFGTEVSISGKHTSGHSICFPSDGPMKCSEVLPCTDDDCLPRVTFVGSSEAWRAKKKLYRRLYELPVDGVYSWLYVLQHTHSAFLDNAIIVDESDERKRRLEEMALFIERSVVCDESEQARAVNDIGISERFGEDAGVEAGDVEEDCPLLVTASAVLKADVGGGVDSDGNVAVDTVLRFLDDPKQPSLDEMVVVPVVRDEEPIVEWTRNGETIASVFPQLFMRGGGCLPDGTWSKRFVYHLMNYYDGRFEKNSRLVSMLFNQLQRHTAVKRAAKIATSHGGVLERFGALVSSVEFRERLVTARANPDSAESRRLNASLLRILSLVGGCVPFSPFERAGSRPKIAALRYRFGVPQHWVTVAPPEHDNLLLHRVAMLRETGSWNDPDVIYSQASCTHADLPQDLQDSARLRLAVSNQYPALAVKVFEDCLRTVFDDVVRCSSSGSTRVSRHYGERVAGGYGKIAAHCAVVEAQVDGRLHVHSLLYGSAVTPELLTRISCCRALQNRVVEWMESVCCTQLTAAVHCEREGDREKNIKTRRAFEIPLPESMASRDEFIAAAQRRVVSTNFHSHSSTCFKGVRGKYMCRLARPAGVYTCGTRPVVISRERRGNLAKGVRPVLFANEIDDAAREAIDGGYEPGRGELFVRSLVGPIVWEMERSARDAMFVETNLTLAALTAAHTNSSVISGEDAGDMVEQYQQAYMTKDEAGLRNTITVLMSAVEHTTMHPSKADDADSDRRKGMYLATRTVNAFAGAHEWSHAVMAYALCGHRSFESSHTFWYVFPHEALREMRKRARGVDCDHVVSERVPASGTESDDVEEELALLAAAINNDSQSSASSGRDTYSSGGARSYRVGDKIVFVSQVCSYLHRGSWFSDFSPLEFECIVDVVACEGVEQSTVENSANAPAECSGRGRPKRKRFSFAVTHPLYGHYEGCIRMKMHTAILGGPPPPRWKPGPSKEERACRKATAEYVLSLFTSWTSDTRSFTWDEEGLMTLCKDWDHSGASFLQRQRYRYLRNVCKHGHRSSHDEQVITDWRNRGVDLWSEVGNQPGPQNSPGAPSDGDDELRGRLSRDMEIVYLARAAISTDPKKLQQLSSFCRVLAGILPDRTSVWSPSNEVADNGIYLVSAQSSGLDTLRGLAVRVSGLEKGKHGLDLRVDRGANHAFDPLAGRSDVAINVADMSAEQATVVKHVLSGILGGASNKQTLTLLHGGGGTGKSYVVRRVCDELAKRDYEAVSTCTTGAGAIQLSGGRTFHSAFKVCRSNAFTLKSLEKMKVLFGPRVALVVVDEVSMLTGGQLVLMDGRLRQLYDKSKAFGGISILLVGDFGQLEVVSGLSLCRLMYSRLAKGEAAAKSLFSQFKVLFLDKQQRASGCEMQQRMLASFRTLPDVYPTASEWSKEISTDYYPVTDEMVAYLTRPLTREDVARDESWMLRSVILVTSNTDRAMLNSSMAKMLALHYNKMLFRWRKPLCDTSRELLGGLAECLYRESERPVLFGYFFSGAKAQILDNKNGNVLMGVANGTACRYHSIAWDDPAKTAIVLELTSQALRDRSTVVDLPFPPEYINVVLLDRDGVEISSKSWPATENLNRYSSIESDGDCVIVPIGIVASNGERFQVSIQSEFGQRVSVKYEQHAVDLAMAMTVWKAQGATFERVIVLLNSSKGSPSWRYEHLYVAASRVRRAEHFRCLPLPVEYTVASLKRRRPAISTVKWRMDIGRDGQWQSRSVAPGEHEKPEPFAHSKKRGRTSGRFAKQSKVRRC